jgi:TRAP-type C4-dicarboxylate transport system permease small subunit
MVDFYLKSMNFLDGIVRKLMVAISGLMTLTIILQVLCRYVLKNPLPWTEELARYLMVWMAFTGASCIIKKWDNIYVDFFINLFKKKPREIALLIQKFIILGLIIYSFYLCITVFPKVSASQTAAALGVSMLWPQSGVIVGFFLMILQNIGVILNDLFKREVVNREDNVQC